MSRRRRAWWAALLLAVPVACVAQVLDFSADERQRILQHGPWPLPPQADASNRVQARPEAVALGRALFFDTGLSRSGAMACATCHQPARAFSDGQPTARGDRNTPGLLDAGQHRWFGWGGEHDSLWAASLAPLLAPHEIGATPATLLARLQATPALLRRYTALFGAPRADETLAVHLAKALAAYQATLVSPRTPFDDFRDALARGDTAAAARYPLAAQRGLRLFIGEGRCAVCHAGPLFSNGEFADIGVPFFTREGVDAGRWAGIAAVRSSRSNRLGPWSDAGPDDARAVGTRHVLREPRHFGEFRVPGLRQLQHTAPYMHNGSLASIEAVVQHYSALNEERLHADGERILRPLRLDDRAAADLAAFLRSLSAR
ncbi:cytochrome-c peroxidase [Rubrivivax sp. RP6-9]|uniref:cytochrome-c peroxidase n=1 Tax=Rubrivivax sp. RP6-9 TaxID=3415750 RepID=UPI003CC60DD6